MAAPSDDEGVWQYCGAWVLAPMVRINTLPFRLLCAEYGAHMVYSEELVDRSIASCRRSLSACGRVEYRNPGGKLIFSTIPHERVAFQLGTASGPDALAAANVVADDVRALDVNMGCPVKFSTQGGMGSALLTQPERIRDILTTLVRNFGGRRAVTCKIRILDSFPKTLELVRLIESCGVDAVAVHCRRVTDRPRFWAQWDVMRDLRAAIPTSLPLLLNGDVFSLADANRAVEMTRANGLMLARGALWNPALFARDETKLVTQASLVSRYISLAEQVENHVGNTKYVALQMLDSHGKTQAFKALCSAKDYSDLRSAASAMKDEAVFCRPPRLPLTLEPPPDLPELAALPSNAWRTVPMHCKSALAHRSCGKPGADVAEVPLPKDPPAKRIRREEATDCVREPEHR